MSLTKEDYLMTKYYDRLLELALLLLLAVGFGLI